MDDTARDRHWLHEGLEPAGDGGEGLAVVNSPLRPVVERSDPWDADVRHHELNALIEPFEAEAPSGARGRIAVLTDVEEDPVARVQTAALMARRLADRGHRVLMVDADVRHVGLSRWLPERDLDAEGLVDVLQYGASVSALRRPGPVERIDVLGVGSYRPDDATVFEEDGLLRLVGQLRAEADVVLIVAPAWITDARFHPLLVHADGVVVSLHLDRSLGPKLQEVLGYLRGLNVPVAGLMTYAGPDAAERTVDEVLHEREASGGVPPVTDASPSGPHAAPLPDAPDASGPSRPVGEEDEATEPVTRPRAIEPTSDDDGRSSRVFRLAAMVSVLALVAFIGWWGLSSRDDLTTTGPPGSGRPPVDVAAGGEDRGDTAPAGLAAVPDDTTDTTDRRETTAGADAADTGGSTDPAGETAAETTDPSVPTTPADASTDATDDDTAVEPAEEPPVPTPEPTPDEPALEDWARDVARTPGGGFALHVASFTEEPVAIIEAERLRRDEGWDPVVRAATIDGRQWYRVLVGRFETRADALAAREPVGEIMGLDWVGVIPVR